MPSRADYEVSMLTPLPISSHFDFVSILASAPLTSSTVVSIFLVFTPARELVGGLVGGLPLRSERVALVLLTKVRPSLEPRDPVSAVSASALSFFNSSAHVVLLGLTGASQMTLILAPR